MNRKPFSFSFSFSALHGVVRCLVLAACVAVGWGADDQVISGPLTYGQNTVVGTTRTTSITTSGQVAVPAGVSVTYQATQLIGLEPGFDAQASGASRFSASLIVPTLTYIAISPAGGTLTAGSSTQLSATANDQSGYALPVQPGITWTLHSGGGSLSSSGLYQAPAGADTVTIYAQSGGATGTATFTIAATVIQPVARFTVAQGTSALSFTFDASTSTGSPALASYTWAFGDGGTGSGRVVSHDYTGSGTYAASLTVTDTGGRISPAYTATVTVAASQPAFYGPSANFYGLTNQPKSVPVGRGWITVTGTSGSTTNYGFVPDRSQPSRYLYFTPTTTFNPTFGSPLEDHAIDLVTFSVSDTAPTASSLGYMGKGWIAHDATGQLLVSDRATTSTYIVLSRIDNLEYFTLNGTNTSNIPSAYYLWTAWPRTTAPPLTGEGAVLNRGWIDGYLNNLQVTPDRAQAAVPCYLATRVIGTLNANGIGLGGMEYPGSQNFVSWVVATGPLPIQMVNAQSTTYVVSNAAIPFRAPPGYNTTTTIYGPAISNPSRSGVQSLGNGYVTISNGTISFAP